MICFVSDNRRFSRWIDVRISDKLEKKSIRNARGCRQKQSEEVESHKYVGVSIARRVDHCMLIFVVLHTGHPLDSKKWTQMYFELKTLVPCK